jgi:hypothetical protein
MADCRFISERGASNSPSSPLSEELFEDYIQPVMKANFPEFVVHLYQFENEPGTIAGEFLESIQDVELVIADLSELTPSAFFQLGLRYNTGKPIVFITDQEDILPNDMAHFDCVRFRFDSAFPDEQAAEDLVNAIRRALERSHASGPNFPEKKLSPRQTRAQLTERLFEAAEAIRLLRINSAAETAIELEAVAKELQEVPEQNLPDAIKETAEKFLGILSRLVDQLSTVRGSRMLISGIIGIVVGGAGFSGLAAFGLSLAFWEGKEPFLKALETVFRRPQKPVKRSAKSHSSS